MDIGGEAPSEQMMRRRKPSISGPLSGFCTGRASCYSKQTLAILSTFLHHFNWLPTGGENQFMGSASILGSMLLPLSSNTILACHSALMALPDGNTQNEYITQLLLKQGTKPLIQDSQSSMRMTLHKMLTQASVRCGPTRVALH